MSNIYVVDTKEFNRNTLALVNETNANLYNFNVLI